MSTILGVTENFVSLLYLLIQSSTLKKRIEHCLTALATLLHVMSHIFIFMKKPFSRQLAESNWRIPGWPRQREMQSNLSFNPTGLHTGPTFASKVCVLIHHHNLKGKPQVWILPYCLHFLSQGRISKMLLSSFQTRHRFRWILTLKNIIMSW